MIVDTIYKLANLFENTYRISKKIEILLKINVEN